LVALWMVGIGFIGFLLPVKLDERWVV
jgi:hypothetical protein